MGMKGRPSDRGSLYITCSRYVNAVKLRPNNTHKVGRKNLNMKNLTVFALLPLPNPTQVSFMMAATTPSMILVEHIPSQMPSQHLCTALLVFQIIPHLSTFPSALVA